MNGRLVNISTQISDKAKKALSLFCKKRGIKINRFVEDAIIEKLEDEIDLAEFELRKNEERISFEDIKKSLKK